MRARRPRVVVRRRARGTHKGAGLGMAATGRAAALRGMTCITFKNGFVEQDWKIVGQPWNPGLSDATDPLRALDGLDLPG